MLWFLKSVHFFFTRCSCFWRNIYIIKNFKAILPFQSKPTNEPHIIIITIIIIIIIITTIIINNKHKHSLCINLLSCRALQKTVISEKEIKNCNKIYIYIFLIIRKNNTTIILNRIWNHKPTCFFFSFFIHINQITDPSWLTFFVQKWSLKDFWKVCNKFQGWIQK